MAEEKTVALTSSPPSHPSPHPSPHPSLGPTLDLMKLLTIILRQEYMKYEDLHISEMGFIVDSFPETFHSRKGMKCGFTNGPFNVLLRQSQSSRLLDWELRIYQAVNMLCTMIHQVSSLDQLLVALTTLSTLEVGLNNLINQALSEVLPKEFAEVYKDKRNRKHVRKQTLLLYMKSRFCIVHEVVKKIQVQAQKPDLDKVELCTAFRDLGRALIFIKVTPEDLKRTYNDYPTTYSVVMS